MAVESIIYVVEDNDAVRDSLMVMMSIKGLKARDFASGAEFLEAVTPTIPGCLLIDFQLRDLDGLAVIEELKARNISLPVIMITGYADEYVRRRTRDAGVVGLVEKPFAFTNVMNRIEAALALSERRMAADERSHGPEVAG